MAHCTVNQMFGLDLPFLSTYLKYALSWDCMTVSKDATSLRDTERCGGRPAHP